MGTRRDLQVHDCLQLGKRDFVDEFRNKEVTKGNHGEQEPEDKGEGHELT
jgi:hypothetical protein